MLKYKDNYKKQIQLVWITTIKVKQQIMESTLVLFTLFFLAAISQLIFLYYNSKIVHFIMHPFITTIFLLITLVNCQDTELQQPQPKPLTQNRQQQQTQKLKQDQGSISELSKIMLNPTFDETLGSIGLTVTSSEGQILYPPSDQKVQQIMQCAAIPSIKLTQQQIFYIHSKKPFIATVQSTEDSIRVHGLAQSQFVGEDNYVGLLILDRVCDGYFSMQKLYVRLSLNILNNATMQFVQSIVTNVSVFTYCLAEVQLLSLQQAFDMGYSILVSIILSMLPTFPIHKITLQINIILLLTVSQLLQQKRAALLMFSCLFTARYNGRIRHLQLQVEQQKSFKLFKSSLATVYLFYLIIYFVSWIFGPDETKLRDVRELGVFFIVTLYLINLCEVVILVQLLGSLFWINRVRGLIWWLIFVVTVYALHYKYGQYLIVPSNFYSLLTPSIFLQSCQYRSILPLILLTPVCQYMDRLNRIKFGGLLILVSTTILNYYSSTIAIIVAMVWICGWIVSVVAREGEFLFLNRRWLSLGEIRALDL